MKFLETGETLATAAAKAGMDQKTAKSNQIRLVQSPLLRGR